MKRVLITGMSGVGKSSVLEELRRRGHHALDTDAGDWQVWRKDKNGFLEQVWDEEKILTLLQAPRVQTLFVSGCVSNQGAFYALFDAVVLLSAPLAVMLQRVAARKNNPYGKTQAQRDEIARYVKTVEPLLRASCTLEIGTATLGVKEVTDKILAFVDANA